jgi:D-serine deaminase-like pyridoxal phosphate-dependent protein
VIRRGGVGHGMIWPVLLQFPDPVVTVTTKGWRVAEPLRAQQVRRDRPALAHLPLSWPLATLDGAALRHNIESVARLCAAAGVEIAPHLKTTMAPMVLQAQLAAGAWGATVATPAQARIALSWGTRQVLLANELVDPGDAADLLERVASGPEGTQLWCYVDSPVGVDLLARAAAGRGERFGVLVELGVPGRRTGVRAVADAVALARAAQQAGLRVLGVAGYEGSVTGTTRPDDLAAVGAYLSALRQVADELVTGGLLADPAAPVVISAGGSSFVDVVLDVLPGPLPGGAPVRVVLRSGAYVAHDHGLYSRTDPWSRIPGSARLRPAVQVLGQVLSVPEPGLALIGVGRRDVPFDQDLPVPLLVHPRANGRRTARQAAGRSVELNDQHLYLRDEPDLVPGDLLALGISHPCTLFDKWRVLPLVEGDRVVDLVETYF